MAESTWGLSGNRLGAVVLGLVATVCGFSAAEAAVAGLAPDPPPVVKRPPPPPPPARPTYQPPPPVQQAPPPPVYRGPSTAELAAQRRAAKERARRRAAEARKHAAAARAAKRRAAAARRSKLRAEPSEAARAAKAGARKKAEAESGRAEVAATVSKPESPVPVPAIAALVIAALLLGLAITPVRAVPGYWAKRTLVDRQDQFMFVGAAGLVAAGLLFAFAFLGG